VAADRGVVVPPHLCRAVARVLVVGLAELSRRDGGVPAAPGLARLLAELSASGHGPVIVGSVPSGMGTSEAAALIGVAPRSARRLAASGRLIARRCGRDWELDPQSVQDYVRERQRAA
jgi:hypothetical protein